MASALAARDRGHDIAAFRLSPEIARVDRYEGEQLTHQLIAWVNDPHCYPLADFRDPQNVAAYDDYQLSAVGVEMEVFTSIKEWEASQEPLERGEQEDVRAPLGPTFITSPWVLALANGQSEAEEANSAVLLKATITSVTRQTNELTGAVWYRAEVDCGFPLILALPGDIEPVPAPGGVVDGTALLLGSSGYWDRLPGA